MVALLPSPSSTGWNLLPRFHWGKPGNHTSCVCGPQSKPRSLAGEDLLHSFPPPEGHFAHHPSRGAGCESDNNVSRCPDCGTIMRGGVCRADWCITNN